MFQDVPGCSGMFHVPNFLYVYEKRSVTCNMQSSRSYRVVRNNNEETRDMTVIDTSTSFYLGVNKMNNCTKQHICESKTHETKMADFVAWVNKVLLLLLLLLLLFNLRDAR